MCRDAHKVRFFFIHGDEQDFQKINIRGDQQVALRIPPTPNPSPLFSGFDSVQVSQNFGYIILAQNTVGGHGPFAVADVIADIDITDTTGA